MFLDAEKVSIFMAQGELYQPAKNPTGDFCKCCEPFEESETTDEKSVQIAIGDDQTQRNGGKRVWFQSVKPWVTGVAGSAFFIMALYQSLSFLVKFTSGPIITIVDLQSVTPNDMPWITICPEPGYSVVEMNKYRGTLFPEDNWTSWTGINPMLFGKLDRVNLTINQWLNKVALPPLTNETRLSVLGLDGLWVEAIFPSNGWDEKGRPGISVETPTILESSVGQWETRLVGLYKHGFQMCSTWKPNVTFRGIELELHLNLRKNFYVNLPQVVESIPDDFLPTFWIHASQPHEALDTYNFATPLDDSGFRHLKIGRNELAKFQMNSEKFQMLSTHSSPCSYDEAVINSSTQCQTKCFEATFMEKACRLPGYRDDNLFLENKPPVCKTTENYETWANLDWGVSSRDVFKSCQAKCLSSCTRMQYDWMDLSGTEGETHEHKDFTGIWNDPKTRVVKYILGAPKRHQKVTRQELAYGSHQLISELGGTWGLFLGLSLVDLLVVLESILIRFM